MRSKFKHSQITIFLILGIVMIMIVVSLLYLTRYTAKKTTRQEAIDTKESILDIQPINKFVTECLSITSKEGLKTLGKQGGYLFKSQGGTLVDYYNSQEGFFFVNHQNSKVVYNILKPRRGVGNYRAPPDLDYPWKTFPYTDETKSEQIFSGKSVYGINNLPPINKSFGQHSMQEQLIVYTTNNIDSCLDFTIFEEQGFEITKNNKNIEVDINEDDVVFRMQYDIIVENLVSGEKTEIKDFFMKHKIRLGKLHLFLNNLIESDISDIKFNILDKSGLDSYFVDIKRDVYNNDDLIIITDEKSTLDSFPFKYIFVRKNRNPSMYYLTPEEIILPAYDNENEGEFTTITNETLITNRTRDLVALDPDEDIITLGAFSIKYNDLDLPQQLISDEMIFTVSVSDGSLSDSQEITVRRG